MTALAFLGFGGSPGAGEMMVVFAVFLLLFGAQRLPSIARTLGRSLEQFRRAAREFRDEIVNANPEPPAPPAPKESQDEPPAEQPGPDRPDG